MQDVVIVTGASSGIGSEVTEKLANKGYRVLAVASREKLLRRLYSFNKNIVPVVADPTSHEGARIIQKYLDREDGTVRCFVYSNPHRSASGISKPSAQATLHLTEQLSHYFTHAKVVLISSDKKPLQKDLEKNLYDSLKEAVDTTQLDIELICSQSVEQVVAEVAAA
ncbi:SDR family NAD(P)-dependent oxidoreductase [Endozoicomonas euniceicola]|uniref:SDR family NAD(P)-dependent oxidoreductase n=1 Tax=Endozoicomonas euniceicola TaxID=1234143 RepID=A0ABY6GX68_9GAMM|nr:SDR family NAD(P)-dependent oxidoreductase [Endozoicomonas euniceicola]UYM17376.1 SDR family NAD(P)-dependent oxidoreductase [Endozoicomonas euniceicola]